MSGRHFFPADNRLHVVPRQGVHAELGVLCGNRETLLQTRVEFPPGERVDAHSV